MAIAAIFKSQLMTNLLASPPVLNKIQDSHGRIRGKRCLFTTAVAMATTDVVVLCRLKATDQIRSIRWNNDLADAGMADVDIGIFAKNDWTDTTIAAAATLDVNALVIAADMKDAAPLFAECLGLGKDADADLISKPIWEAAAVAARPEEGTEYDIVLTCNDSVDAVSNYTILIDYMAGD